jgi:hypothetical protein
MITVQVITRDDPHSLVISRHMLSDAAQDHSKDRDEELTLRAQVNARCQDLISVVGGRLEFLHRSVRDFLDESKSVSKELDGHAGYYFDAHFTLIASYVFLIKKHSTAAKSGIGGENLKSTIVNWCNEALMQMRTVPFSPWAECLVRELGDSMRFMDQGARRDHWSVFLPDGLTDTDNTPQRALEQPDLISHLIQLDLVSYVAALLKTPSTSLGAKKGRPYLDFALRGSYRPQGYPKDRSSMVPLHEPPDTCSLAMVELLLKLGSDVNESWGSLPLPLATVDGHHADVYDADVDCPVLRVELAIGLSSPQNSIEPNTVWNLFLGSLPSGPQMNEDREKIAWLLIEHGARSIDNSMMRMTHRPYHGGVEEMAVDERLVNAFGERQAGLMQRQLIENEIAESGRSSESGRWWPWSSIRNMIG